MRLVFAMGFEDNEKAFLKALETHCSIVQSRFHELFREDSLSFGESAGIKASPEADDPGNEKPKPASASMPGGPGPQARLALEKLQDTLNAYPSSVKSEVLTVALEKFSSVGDPGAFGEDPGEVGYIFRKGRSKDWAEKAVWES